MVSLSSKMFAMNNGGIGQVTVNWTFCYFYPGYQSLKIKRKGKLAKGEERKKKNFCSFFGVSYYFILLALVPRVHFTRKTVDLLQVSFVIVFGPSWTCYKSLSILSTYCKMQNVRAREIPLSAICLVMTRERLVASPGPSRSAVSCESRPE